MQKKIINLILCFVLTVSLSSCAAGNKTWQTKAFISVKQSVYLEKSEIAENENFVLIWDNSKKQIMLKEKANNRIFSMSPISEDEAQFDELGMPIKRHPQLESALLVEYINPDDNVGDMAVSYTDAVKNGHIRSELISNGLKVEYYFDSVEIMVPVSYILRDDSLSISINPKEIQEGKYRITRISVAPFFCSVKNKIGDGYLVYPSGSGAVTYSKEISQEGLYYSGQVYGEDLAIEKWDEPTTDEDIKIPMFGAVSKGNGICAIIEKGEESALIEMRSGAKAYGYSSVYSTFQLRGYTDNIAKMFSGTKVKDVIYANSMTENELSVGFYPLSAEESDYSGMAKVYRDYAKEKYKLNKSVTDNTPLNIKILGGTEIKNSFLGIPYTSLYALTTLNEAENIIDDISNNAEISNINLIGFGESGLNVGKLCGGYKIGNSLGTDKQMKKLVKYCKGKNINLYMDFDPVNFSGKSLGVASSAKSVSNKIAYCYDYDLAVRGRLDDTRYELIARKNLLKSCQRIISKTDKWGLDGISLSSLSNKSYSDYSDKSNTSYYVKGGMARDVEKYFSTLKSAGKKIMSSEANSFAAYNSDFIFDAPTKSGKENIFDEDIPLYEMALKGYVGISGESINLSYNSEYEILKAVESGMGITYTVMNNYSNRLIDSNRTVFYNCKYSDIKEQIVSNYNKLKEYYSKVGNAEIIDHQILDNGLRVTTFENGVTAYVNFTAENLDSPHGTVNAYGYLIKEGN